MPPPTTLSESRPDTPALSDGRDKETSRSTLRDSEAGLTESVHSRLARLSTRLPRPVRIVWLYIRGPRPKENLPYPSPFLDIDITLRGKRYAISIESTFVRKTSFLTTKWLFSLIVAAYIIGLAFITRAQWYLIPSDSFIECTSSFWLANGDCGLDGQECAPFTNATYDFRCPAQCSSVTLANPRTVGVEAPVYVPLLVGGGDSNHTYRGDSFVCAAAIQSGLITNSQGGCASLELTGNFTDYLSFTGAGLTSVGFPTVFPLSYRFSPNTSLTHCKDLRDSAMAYNILITVLLFLLLRPPPIALFWSMLCVGFWHITLFSQPRSSPPALSDAFGDFLPALFVGYALWRIAFRFTFPAFRRAPIESTVWFLAPFWTGVLSNMTFDKVPIDRLLASDLQKRPGAITALIIIVIVVFVAVVNQARVIRKTGWVPFYAGWYIIGGLVVMVLALLPGFQLRLHHYIIGLILLPITAFPTRLSLIYQGFLLGLFLQGVAAYGFDSMLQTVAELRRDDIIGSDIPTFLTNSSNWNSSIPLTQQVITWAPVPSTDWDGFSVLVDDVERYIGNATNLTLAAFQTGITHFFRVAYTSGSNKGDYTKTAVLWPNGTWQEPEEGAT